MPRPLFDSPYIFGLHDPGGEGIMAEAGRRGWIVFTEAVGTNPNDFSGRDYTPWANQDFGIICRINNGYGAVVTIPDSSQYADFARRVGNFVAASRGCKIWVIGNEMNFSQEWPLKPGVTASAVASVYESFEKGPEADPFGRSSPDRFSALHHSTQESAGAANTKADARTSAFEMITPELYARCFRLCRNAIKTTPGHGDDQVVTGAVAPWNDQAKYATNPNGDWVKYLQDMLTLIGAGGLDGIALHTYTHGSEPALITSTATMNAPFQNRYYNFLTYQNFMAAIPPELRKLPVYVTETDQDVAWLDANNGWVQAAYAEIDRWNRTAGNQQIRALVLYRWPPLDKWFIEGKQGVIAMFREALRNDYQWKPPLPAPANWKAGDVVRALDALRLRESPGGPSITSVPLGTELTILSSTYQVRARRASLLVSAAQTGNRCSGWVGRSVHGWRDGAPGISASAESVAIRPRGSSPDPNDCAHAQDAGHDQ
ncbi:MAG: hypothetical protein IPK16_01205 [Anaerolineales bacterium]|nr:hypothetical protein [Anaerolineales bacterium]